MAKTSAIDRVCVCVDDDDDGGDGDGGNLKICIRDSGARHIGAGRERHVHTRASEQDMGGATLTPGVTGADRDTHRAGREGAAGRLIAAVPRRRRLSSPLLLLLLFALSLSRR